jgi:DNA-binding Xre family transcriptional regulator
MAIQVDWDKIRKLMLENGMLSWPQLASKAGLHKQHVWELSTGRHTPGLATLGKIARALHCSLGDLLKGG